MKAPIAVSILGLALLASTPARALPEGPAAGGPVAPEERKPGVFPVVVEIEKDEDAKALLKALDDALDGDDDAKVVEALKPLVTKSHKSFVSPLKKLLSDKRDEVAAGAAEALGSQGDKGVASALLGVVKQEIRERGFLKRTDVKAAAIESLGRLGVAAPWEGILKLSEAMLREPEIRTSYAAPLLRASVRYFGLVKEKRVVGFLAEQVDEPVPADVASGTNPPAEYWKARHEAWMVIKGEVAWALKEITGKEMENSRRWKSWLEDEGKKLGMK